MDVDHLIADILSDLKANRLQLPTLPVAAVKINDIVDSRDATAKKVAKVLVTDAALSARIIQVANSPRFGSVSAVDNVQAAVTRLGMRMVRNLVTSFLVRHLFHTRYPLLRRRMTILWNHSIHVAAISFVLADHYSGLKPDEAMLAGLIHDIGKLPIIAKAENYPQLAEDEAAIETISERLHPLIGKLVVETWRFPAPFISVAAEHEDLTRDSPKADLTDIVTVANLHSYSGKKPPRTHADIDWGSVPAFNKLGLDPQRSIEVLKGAHDEILKIQQLLSG